VTEARKLGLPVVAVVDTNCDPTSSTTSSPERRRHPFRFAHVPVLADAVVEGRFIADFRRKNAPHRRRGELGTSPARAGRRLPCADPAEPEGRRTRRDCAWRGRVCRRHARSGRR